MTTNNLSAPLAPSLPLTPGNGEAFRNIREFAELAKQNLKMLIMTNPGERVMDVDFGVGASSYLFEMNDLSVQSEIASKIEDQVERYLPYITIESIEFEGEEEKLYMQIKFAIESIGTYDELTIPSS
jgi:phage baseplate assembly protein W